MCPAVLRCVAVVGDSVVWQLLVIVMELAEGGDLKELKPEAGCLLDEHTLLPVVVQVVVVLLVRGLTCCCCCC